MKNRMLFDYFSCTLKPDENSDIELSVNDICHFFNLNPDDFVSCGKVKYYEEMFKFNDITIKVPTVRNAHKQGFNVSMSGQGMRFYEQCQKDGEIVSSFEIWKELFMRLRALNNQGISFTVSRFDIAMDDFNGLITMDRIMEYTRNRWYNSRLRNPVKREGRTNIYELEEVITSERFVNGICGTSIQFGSRESRSFCRIYDKKSEQLQKNFKNPEIIEQLEAIEHWTRLEFEFKKEMAIGMVNAVCDIPDFWDYYRKYVNGMLRFVEESSDSNRSRWSLASWWSEFIGSFDKISFCLGKYEQVSIPKFKRYIQNMLGVVYTAMCVNGVDTLLESACSFAMSGKLNSKHKLLCGGIQANVKDLTSEELWEVLRPAASRDLLSKDDYLERLRIGYVGA